MTDLRRNGVAVRRGADRPGGGRRRLVVAIVLVVVVVGCSAAVPALGATGTLGRAVSYLESRQRPDGGFAEPGRVSDPSLTAWAVLGLAAAGRAPAGAAAYLSGRPYPSATDLELRIMALDALGRDVSGLVRQLEGLVRSSGQIGPTLNSTMWGMLALRTAGRPVARATVRFLKAAQSGSGGWGWGVGLKPDTDDTAAAVQALRAAGVGARSATIRRALGFIRARQNADGGFESDEGRGSNAQSTAWAVQAFLAAGASPGARASAYLGRMQRADGSLRFSRQYVTTPTWITAQAATALARKPFPLR